MLILVCGLSISWVLQKELHFQAYSFELASVVVSTVYGGMGPGLLCAVLAVVGIDKLFFGPLGDLFQHRYVPASVHLLVFMCTSLLLGYIVASLRNALREATDQRRRAERATRSRDNVLAVVSHDLKNPLSNISLNCDLLRRLAGRDGIQLPMQPLNGIERSIGEMGRLIQDLLDTARLDAGDFTMSLKPSDPAAVAERVVRDFALIARDKGVALRFRDLSEGARAQLDPARFGQAISNLVSNALKFTPSGGAVDVEIRSSRECLEIEVRDTGPGIAPESIDRLFDRFWQARETAHLGTGLGLYIARGIVNAHGGEIRVKSELGRGTSFVILLPGRLRTDAQGPSDLLEKRA